MANGLQIGDRILVLCAGYDGVGAAIISEREINRYALAHQRIARTDDGRFIRIRTSEGDGWERVA